MRHRASTAFFIAALNLGSAAPVDALRFLRVPAIHLLLRRELRHFCRSRTCRHPRPSRRS